MLPSMVSAPSRAASADAVGGSAAATLAANTLCRSCFPKMVVLIGMPAWCQSDTEAGETPVPRQASYRAL